MELAGARIPVQIDFGFGDVVVPAAVEVAYPTLLDFPAPVVRAYPRETVVAEKFQAMVSLGEGNTSMKDFYDVWFLADRFPFKGAVLAAAIAATFERRRTDLPDAPPRILSKDYAQLLTSANLWRAFVGRSFREPDTDLQFADVVAKCSGLVMPVVQGLTHRGNFAGIWEPSGPWETGDGSRYGASL